MKNFENRIISDILKLVSIQSFTDNREGIEKCQKMVEEIAMSLGFVTSYHSAGSVLVIEPKSVTEKPELGIVVHLDTVPYDEKEWKTNPLGEIKDGRIYGRGVVDDKAAIVLAMYAMLQEENKIKPSWQIIVGSSEEGSWTDMQGYLKEKNVLPKFLITIDGDGVQNGCRGYMDLELTFKRKSNSRHLSNLKVINGANNAVPGKAIAVVDDAIIEVTGKAAHSSIPQIGENALINLLYSLYHIDTEFPGLFKIALDLKGNYNARHIFFKEHPEIVNGQNVGFTSVCMTNCYYLEDVIVANLNIRFSPQTTKGEINRAIERICLKYGCTSEIKELKMPAYISPETREIKMMLEAYKEVLGKETESTVAMGCGYNSTLPNCAIFGPRFAVNHDEEDTCHSVDENRSVEDLLTFFEMLCKFIDKYYS